MPAHCCIRGNECADALAKEGARKTQEDASVTYDEAKTLIKAHQKDQWQLQHPGSLPNDGYYHLARKDQVLIFRLRTGHNRLRHQLHTKLGIGQTSECPCGQGPMTTEHILQSCPMYHDLRMRKWPTPTHETRKLFGPLADLQTTAAFIRETGLNI